MSADDVEVVRRAFEAFARRDDEALVEMFHPEAEWRPAISPGGIERQVYVGPEGLRSWLADVDETWEFFEVGQPEVEAVGDRVLVLGRARVKGRASGAVVEAPLAQVWTLADGKAWRVQGFTSHEDAKRAAGL